MCKLISGRDTYSNKKELYKDVDKFATDLTENVKRNLMTIRY